MHNWPSLNGLCMTALQAALKAQAEPWLPAAPVYSHSHTPYLPSIKLFIPVVNHGLGPGQSAVFDGVLTDG